MLGQLFFKQHEFFNLAQEPWINFRGLENAPKRDAQFERVVNMKQPVPTGTTKTLHDGILVAHLTSVSA